MKKYAFEHGHWTWSLLAGHVLLTRLVTYFNVLVSVVILEVRYWLCGRECRICNREVAGLNLGHSYFAPRSTQPSIPPGLVSEYQLWLGRQGQVWLIPLADETCEVKVSYPLTMHAIPERLRHASCGGAVHINDLDLYLFTRFLYKPFSIMYCQQLFSNVIFCFIVLCS